ncbi:unnamed protein product [Owenia fusiformis]|uniref:Uncharacterized protein n=1 Tax=Owenia fusiformis TaxID=6347 RepID=A0A8J1UB07_OWEFU|nr:unnamed protein product [Owenia fusiformis]
MTSESETSSHERQQVLNRLLDAVKQCQVRFGGKSELATDGDSRVSCLCAAWESALQHGMKHTNKGLSALKQVSEITGLTKMKNIGVIQDLKKLETEPVFWHYVKEFLSKHEQERYLVLKNIDTDAGRGRAWLRASLNEHSLERHMHMLLENQLLLSQYFEEHALLRDVERSSMMPVMSAGLGSILFAISIDNPELNTIKPATSFLDSIGNRVPPSTQATDFARKDEPRPVIGGEATPPEKRKERKKKKKVAKVVSFDNDEPSSYSSSPATPSYLNSLSPTGLNPTVQKAAKLSTSAPVSNFTFSGYMTQRDNIPESISEIDKQINNGIKNSDILNNQNNSVRNTEKTEGSRILPVETVQSIKEDLDHPGFISKAKDTKTMDDPIISWSGESINAVKYKQIEPTTKNKTVQDNIIKSKIETDHVSNNPFEDDTQKVELDVPVSSNPFDLDSGLETKPRNPFDTDEVKQNIETISKETYPTTQNPFEEMETKNAIHNSTNHSIVDSIAVKTDTISNEKPKSPEILSDEKSDINDVNEDSFLDIYSSSKEQKPRMASLNKSSSDIMKADSPSPSLGSSSSFDFEQQYGSGVVPSDLTPLAPSGDPNASFTMAFVLGGDDNQSEDSIEVPTYSFDTDNAMSALAQLQKGSSYSVTGQRTAGDGEDTTPSPHLSSETLTTSELKQAVVDMMIRKDQMEDQNKSLKLLLEQENNVTSSLRAEIENIKSEHLSKAEKDKTKIQALSRENELLKQQLKKYVSAVQMLRREDSTAEGLSGLQLEKPQPPIPPPRQLHDFSNEASQYEQKLIQVAEMHGELMEFNELLHKQLNARELELKRLKQELVDLRGPLPEDMPHDDSGSLSSDYDNLSLNSRPLISVWIPSAFLRGTSSDNHHVYQVYIRIRDKEWNVYRRYAEFNVIHNKLRKVYSIVNTFNFPPKKALGNKGAKFVEDRRKKLQSYLRRIINLLMQNNTTLANNATKETLIQLIPFFGDPPANQKEESKKGRFSRKSSKGQLPKMASSSQLEEQERAEGAYNGL